MIAAALGALERPSRLEFAFVGLLAASAGWIALSLAWTTTQSGTGAELDRMLVYVAGALAVVTIVSADRVAQLLGGVVTGVVLVCLYALSTRLFPQASQAGSFAASRLNTPIGYWNGLGVLAAMGTMLALVFAARARAKLLRAVAAAAVPVLVVTLYFTFSRGSWAALFVGAVLLFVVERQRAQLFVNAVPSLAAGAFVVWRASKQSALTHTSASTLQAAAHEGRSLAAVIAAACLFAAFAAWALAWADPVWKRRRVVIAARFLAAVAIVVGLGAVMARYGSPVTLAKRGYDSFNTTGGPSATPDLNSRLFSLASNGRIPAWKIAWRGFTQHPVTGLGAGGFENYWNQHRVITLKIRDAHNFYVETLGEEGILGSLLLFGALAVPFVALRRARWNPLASGAFAAFAVFLVHAIADWDWELSGVTLVALFCGASLLVMGRRSHWAGASRWPLLATGAVVGVVALAGLAARLSLNASTAATRVADTSKAMSEARLAHFLMPWASEPWQALGAAQLASGEQAQAAVSYRHAEAQNPGDYRSWIDLAKADTGHARWHDFVVALNLNPLGQDQTRTIAQQLLNPNPGANS